MPASAVIDATGALDAFEDLLRAVAGGLVPNRAEAIAYVTHRATLLAAELGDALPGFVQQCQSISRFKDFIGLYDRDANRRLAFIETSLAPSRTKLAMRPAWISDEPATQGWSF